MRVKASQSARRVPGAENEIVLLPFPDDLFQNGMG
jgi:hypothetical protein